MARRKPGWIRSRLESLLVWLVAGYIRFVYWSGKYEHLNEEVPQAFWDARRAGIGVLWHNRLLLGPKVYRSEGTFSALISRHGDGDVIAKVLTALGHSSVRGSAASLAKPKKNKGGAAAFISMMKVIEKGGHLGITPDGPKGPRYRVKKGVVLLAKHTGVPIVPFTYSTRRAIVLNSWDKFLLPLPFSRGVFIWGNPIEVPADADDAMIESIRELIESELQRITTEADRHVGRTPIEPGPARALRGPAATPSDSEDPNPDAQQVV